MLKSIKLLNWLSDQVGFLILLAAIAGLSYKAGTQTKVTVEIREVIKEVEVRVKTIPLDFAYCDEKSCIWATPDGLRIRNYTNKSLNCKLLPVNEQAGVRGVQEKESSVDWWAIGRPGPFLTCNPEK